MKSFDDSITRSVTLHFYDIIFTTIDIWEHLDLNKEVIVMSRVNINIVQFRYPEALNYAQLLQDPAVVAWGPGAAQSSPYVLY